MIHSDTHYVIGQSHLNNEDYVISGDTPFPYIILADGCSSSEYSDIGARMLVMAAQEYLLNHIPVGDVPSPESVANYASLKAEAAARVIGAPTNAIDATLMVAFVQNEKVYVYLFGDGSVLTKGRAGKVQLATVDYSHNAPYYPSYLTNGLRNAEYRARSIGAVRTVDVDGVKEVSSLFSPSVFVFPVDSLSLLMIASDGVSSFVNTETAQSVEAQKVFERLMQLRNTNGDFVKRKLKRALKNWAKEGMVNIDDLSVGAMVFPSAATE